MKIPIYLPNTLQAVWVTGTSFGLIVALKWGIEFPYIICATLAGFLFHTGKYIRNPRGLGYIKQPLSLISLLFYFAIYFLFEGATKRGWI